MREMISHGFKRYRRTTFRLIEPAKPAAPPEPRMDLIEQARRGSDTRTEWSMENAPEGGEYTNNPEQRPGVIRETDANETEVLPEVGTTKNRVAIFSSMETTGTPPSPYQGDSTKKRSPPPMKTLPVSDQNGDGELVSEPNVRTDVVRETDEMDAGLPPAEMTKNIRAMFQNMGSADGKTAGEKRMKEFTPPRESPARNATAKEVLQNEPSQDDKEVIRCDQLWDDSEEQPPPDVTRGMVAKFQQLEKKQRDDREKSPVIVRRPRGEWGTTVTYKKGEATTNPPVNGTDNLDLSQDGGEYENDPTPRGDVFRETDNQEDDRPQSGTTKNLLAKFQA